MAGSAAWHKGARSSHFGASKVYIDAHRILAVVSTLRLAGWNHVLEDANKLKTSLISKVKSVKLCCLLLCVNMALGCSWLKWMMESQSLLKWKMENLIRRIHGHLCPPSFRCQQNVHRPRHSPLCSGKRIKRALFSRGRSCWHRFGPGWRGHCRLLKFQSFWFTQFLSWQVSAVQAIFGLWSSLQLPVHSKKCPRVLGSPGCRGQWWNRSAGIPQTDPEWLPMLPHQPCASNWMEFYGAPWLMRRMPKSKLPLNQDFCIK